MKTILTALLLLFLFQTNTLAQDLIKLYEGKPPGSENWTWSEQESTKNAFNTRIVYNVSEPSIRVYRPRNPVSNGTAVIIAPGGAFHTLSMHNEGSKVAEGLNAKGITAFVLSYRLVRSLTSDPVNEMMALLRTGDFAKLDSINAPIVRLAMADGLAAMKYVRSHAKTYNIDPAKIGFIGFSAGATLAMSVVYNATDESRPNFVAPVYAYEKAIIGSDVPKGRLPIFIAAASDDNLGFATHSISIYEKWLSAKQPAELHMYQKGGHGFGMNKTNITTDSWFDRFTDWLKMNGF